MVLSVWLLWDETDTILKNFVTEAEHGSLSLSCQIMSYSVIVVIDSEHLGQLWGQRIYASSPLESQLRLMILHFTIYDSVSICNSSLNSVHLILVYYMYVGKYQSITLYCLSSIKIAEMKIKQIKWYILVPWLKSHRPLDGMTNNCSDLL